MSFTYTVLYCTGQLVLQRWDLLICSNCSRQMSKWERFAQIPQDKWATVSESLRSLMTNERMWAIHSYHSWPHMSFTYICKKVLTTMLSNRVEWSGTFFDFWETLTFTLIRYMYLNLKIKQSPKRKFELKILFLFFLSS